MNFFIVKEKEKFEKYLSENQKVFICFFADWCGPCMKLGPIIKNISDFEEFKDITFLKVNIELLPEVASLYKVTSIPFMVLINSDKKENLIGFRDELEISEIVRKFFN